VQTSPSSQPLPSTRTGFEQLPVAGSQVPTSWHPSLAVHATGLPSRHAPAWHESTSVQAFPSLHAVPSGAAGFEQAPVAAEQVPA
jgi:hypothetical protein